MEKKSSRNYISQYSSGKNFSCNPNWPEYCRQCKQSKNKYLRERSRSICGYTTISEFLQRIRCSCAKGCERYFSGNDRSYISLSPLYYLIFILNILEFWELQPTKMLVPFSFHNFIVVITRNHAYSLKPQSSSTLNYLAQLYRIEKGWKYFHLD